MQIVDTDYRSLSLCVYNVRGAWFQIGCACTCTLYLRPLVFLFPSLAWPSCPHCLTRALSSIVTSSIVFSAIFSPPYLSDILVLVELRLVWSFQGGFTLIVFWLLCEYFISVLCADTEKELGKSFKICGHANAASCDVNFVVISLFLRLLFGVWGLKTVNAAEFFLMTFEPV